MNRTTQSRAALIGDVAIVAVTVLLTGAAIAGGALPTAALVGVVALAVGTYIGIRHPLWLFWSLAFSLGALPFGYFPGVHLPLTFGLGVAVLLATLLHPTLEAELSNIAKVVLLLVLASGVSVAATATSVTDISEFAKWSFATLTFVALTRLSSQQLAMFGRVYVYASAMAALFGIAILAGDPAGKFIGYLSFVGYGREESSTRFVYSASGNTVRLAGTYIDPNTAGIGLVVALVVALVLFSGWRRGLLVTLFMVAITLTLSRAALFSVFVGIILVLLFHTLSPRQRGVLLGVMGVAALAALATPQVRTRVFSSFGSGDAGSSARADALADLPGHMSGHWIFGLGWGRVEFKDPSAAFEVNYVANAPLLTVYRGGIVVGVIFAVLLVMCCVTAYKTLRGQDLGAAALGGVFIGFCLVALQLDFPVVTIPSVTMMFSVFMAFLVYAYRESVTTERLPESIDACDNTDTRTLRSAPPGTR